MAGQPTPLPEIAGLRASENPLSMILPTYPAKIPQTSPNPQKERLPS